VVNSVSCDEEKYVVTTVVLQHGIRGKSGAEQPRYPLTRKPGINVDLEDPSNPLEYYELFCTPEIVEVMVRETNQYAQKCLENTSNLKLRSRAVTGRKQT
jgi:hypothetical protein